MTVPSRSVRTVTRLYFIVWKRVPTVGPSSLLEFSGEWTVEDKDFNSKFSNSGLRWKGVKYIVILTANPIKSLEIRRRYQSNRA